MRILITNDDGINAPGLEVLTEIATHSMAGSTLDAVCTAERHDKLLGQSGLRGATTDWLIRPHLARTPGP